MRSHRVRSGSESGCAELASASLRWAASPLATLPDRFLDADNSTHYTTCDRQASQPAWPLPARRDRVQRIYCLVEALDLDQPQARRVVRAGLITVLRRHQEHRG